MTLLQWCERIQKIEWLSSSIYTVPVFNLVHLLCMSMFLGALLMVDLRLLGGLLKGRPVREIAREAHPWLVWGFMGLLITGIPAWMATAPAQYFSPVFHFKMYVLIVAVIYTFVVRRKVTQADEARVGPIWSKVVALLSIGLWVTVAVSARLIMLI